MEQEKCKNCGAIAVVVDFVTDEAVCEACGIVAEAGLQLTYEHTCAAEPARFEEPPPDEYDKDPDARARIMDRLRAMASMLICGNQILEEAKLLVNETRRRKGSTDVDAYCGAILYISARRNLLPITLHEISLTLGIEGKELGKMYKLLVRTAGICIPGHNLNLLTDRFIDQMVSHMDSQQLFPPPPPKSSKKAKLEAKKKEKDSSSRALFYERPTKESLIAVMHDVKEFLFHQELHRKVKPMVFVAAVLALGIESKFSLDRAPPLITEFCKQHGIHFSPVRDYKKLIKRELTKKAKHLPGCEDIKVSKMPRRLPQVVNAWKRLQAIQEKCVEKEEEEEEEEEPVPLAPFEEGVAPTPLVVLLQEAGMIGDVTTRKVNRGYCPPENYDMTFPRELAKFVTPARIKIEGLSSSSESEGESPDSRAGNKQQEGENRASDSKSPPVDDSKLCKSLYIKEFYKKYWEKCELPGRPGKQTFFLDPSSREGEGDYRYFKTMRPSLAGKSRSKPPDDRVPNQQQPGAAGKRKRPEICELNVDTGGVSLDSLLLEEVQSVKPVAADDEFDREGLSDIDDAEIDGYIMGPQEVVVRAVLMGTEVELPLRKPASVENCPVEETDDLGEEGSLDGGSERTISDYGEGWGGFGNDEIASVETIT